MDECNVRNTQHTQLTRYASAKVPRNTQNNNNTSALLSSLFGSTPSLRNGADSPPSSGEPIQRA